MVNRMTNQPIQQNEPQSPIEQLAALREQRKNALKRVNENLRGMIIHREKMVAAGLPTDIIDEAIEGSRRTLENYRVDYTVSS